VTKSNSTPSSVPTTKGSLPFSSIGLARHILFLTWLLVGVILL